MAEQGWTEARSFLHVSHVHGGAHAIGPSSSASSSMLTGRSVRLVTVCDTDMTGVSLTLNARVPAPIFFLRFILKVAESTWRRESSIFYLLFYSPDVCNSQHSDRPKSESSFGSPMRVIGPQVLETFCAAFPWPLIVIPIGSRAAAGTWATACIDCQHCIWRLYPLCHNISPNLNLLVGGRGCVKCVS